MDVKFEVLKYGRGQKIQEGDSLITVAQAEASQHRERLKQQLAAGSPAELLKELENPRGAAIRLKNGVLILQGPDPSDVQVEVVHTYRPGLKYMLVSKGPADQEPMTLQEDCLIALAYAAEHDDADEVEALVKCGGEEILSTRMPFTYIYLGTILHVCTMWASSNTLEMVLKSHPHSVDVYILDRDGDTALHNLPNNTSLTYDDCKRAACSLLGLQGVNPNTLLSIRNNYGNWTAVCKALMYEASDVCKALLDAGKEMEEREQTASKALRGKEMEEKEESAGSIKAPAGHWLTLTAHERNDKHTLYTALHLAVLREYGDIVSRILEYPRAKGLKLTSLPDHEGQIPLHTVAWVGDTDICSTLLKYSTEINKEVRSQNNVGQTPLHIASALGHVGVCERLLEYGAPLHLPDNHGKYVLTNAFIKGDKQVVEKLLDACLPRSSQEAPILTKSEERSLINPAKSEEYSLINAKFEFGLTPLHVAVAISSEHHVSNLLDAGARVDSATLDGRTPLHVATQQYDQNVFFELLRKTKELNFKGKSKKGWINMRDVWGQTALHNIVRPKDQSDSAREEDGGEMQTKDQSDSTREEEGGAMQTNDKETSTHEGDEISLFKPTTRKLCMVEEIHFMCSMRGNEFNTDEVCAQTNDKETSTHEGDEIGSCEEKKNEFNTDEICEIVRELLEEGAWVDVQDRDGETALHKAAQRLDMEVVEALLSPGRTTDGNFQSRVNNRDKWIVMCDFSGETALHEAARTNCLKIVSLLLNNTNRRADLLRVRDMKNMTALDWAAQNVNTEMIEEMMKHLGNDLITKDFLMWNLKEHINPFVHKWLCNKYNVKGNQTSLLENAVQKKDVDIARELINRGADVPSLNYNERRWLAQNLGKKASDQPTSEDTLGRRALVQGVANLLLNPYTETPITIGIFGSWGTGKSSFMLQVEEAMLCMVVKETFRKTPYNLSHDKVEASSLKFSIMGRALRCMVVKALTRRMIKADKCIPDNQSTCGKALLAKLALNQITLKIGDYSKRGTADIEHQKDEDDIINSFPMELQSKHRQLFRDLALTDRSKLVHSHGRAWYKRMIGTSNQTLQDAHLTGHIPTILTLHYNAWQYDNKTEASAGLAVEISHQLESFMTPHQWLRMCWKYSWNSRPKEICIQLLLPTLLALIVVCVVLIFWKLVPIGTKYKALSLPMGIVGVMWVFFKTSLKVIQPVTQAMLSNPKSIDHQSMLGYHHQVIHDIKFLKDHLCSDANFFWKFVSILCQLFISNNYFMEGTWIWKQHPQPNNFRIVVFIDDLDRCDEKTILELLRATNLILGSCGISAVIGVDKDMVQRAITKEFLKDNSENESYKLVEKNLQVVANVDRKTNQEGKESRSMGNDDNHMYTRELADKYLQKIIQLPIEMPDLSRKHVEHFLEEHVGKLQKDKEDVEEKQVKDEGDIEIEDGIDHGRKGEGDPIIFRLILANYTPMEKDMLKQLCELTTKERGSPREWKRFLNYHRIAWTILSEDRNMKSKEFKGWQRKLILWIFICWNWRDQMDAIFENWHDILSKISKQQTHIHLQGDDKNDFELCDIIYAYMKNKGWITKEDSDQKIGEQVGEIAPGPWIDLHKTLIDKYDIPVHFIEKFQQFRFYCKLNHLEIHEHYKGKKMVFSKSRKSNLRLGHEIRR